MVRGKCLSSDVRKMVVKVMTFFENEKKDSSSRIPVDQVMKRTALATGVSERTLSNIKNELKNRTEPDSETDLLVPRKRKGRQKLKINDAMIIGIKKIINDFYTIKGEEPTLRKVLAAAKKELNFPGQKNTLLRLLQSKGYRFEKSANVQKLTDQNGVTEISASEEVTETLAEPSNLTNASVSENGCTLNTELLCKTENIYDDIDIKHSPPWHNEKTVQNLPNSNIYTDNSTSTNKNNMQNWLHDHNIGYENVPIDYEIKIEKAD